jgi:hypothetical protein
MGSEGTVPLILDFGTREKSILSRFDLFTSDVYVTVPSEKGTGEAPKLVWTLSRKELFACRHLNHRGIV